MRARPFTMIEADHSRRCIESRLPRQARL